MYEQREGELFSTKRLKLVAHAKTECVRITLEMPLTDNQRGEWTATEEQFRVIIEIISLITT